MGQELVGNKPVEKSSVVTTEAPLIKGRKMEMKAPFQDKRKEGRKERRK